MNAAKGTAQLLHGIVAGVDCLEERIRELEVENTEMRELLAQWVYGWDHMSEYPVGSTRNLLERTK